MTLATSLALWAAVATFLTAFGAFLDKYHIKGKRLENVRAGLVTLWLKLEGRPLWFYPVDNDNPQQRHARNERQFKFLFRLMLIGAFVSPILMYFGGGFQGKSAPVIMLVGVVTLINGFLSPIYLIATLSVLFFLPILLCQLLVLGLRAMGLGVLEAASSPDATPFTYLGALIGLLGAAASVVAKVLT